MDNSRGNALNAESVLYKLYQQFLENIIEQLRDTHEEKGKEIFLDVIVHIVRQVKPTRK